MARTKLPRDQKREAIRTSLVEAAEELFAERGFWGVSIDEIADRAELTKGAVYSNFGGKEDLLLAVTARQVVRVEESQLPDPSVPFRKQVREIGRLVARAAMAQGVRRVAPRELELASLALHSERFRTLLADAARQQSVQIGELLKARATDQGIELGLSVAELGRLLTAIRLGLTRMLLIDPEAVPESYFADAFELIVLGALAREPRRRRAEARKPRP